MTPEVTLEDGTELFAYPSLSCAGCYFDDSNKCLKYAHGLTGKQTLHCVEVARKDKRSVAFFTKEQYLLRCMTEGAP